MDIVARPCKISGTINAVSSKSEAHRIFLCAALSENPSEISLNDTSLDIDASLECIKAMGAEVTRRNNIHTVIPFAHKVEQPILDCKSSGSTLRFFIPAVTAVFPKAKFICEEQLANRPIKPLLEALSCNGVSFSSYKMPIESKGLLHSGTFHVPGNISSQFISGLLFALPLLDGNSKIIIDSPLKSKTYAEMTIKIIRQFGIKIHWVENEITIQGGQKYISPGMLTVCGDYSNSAVMLSAAALGGRCSVSGLMPNSVQGDKAILDCLKKFGADVSVNADICSVTQKDRNPLIVDVSNVPDIFPVLAVLACGAVGKSHFYGTGRLKYKESDRCKSVQAMLSELGVKCVSLEEEFVIFGTGSVNGGTVNSANDHRIVMAAALASVIAKGDIKICGCESVRKSYSEFFKDFNAIGGSTYIDSIRQNI